LEFETTNISSNTTINGLSFSNGYGYEGTITLLPKFKVG
jgi:hypothetical protein